MNTQWDPVVLDAVERSSKRAAANVREDLRDGVYDLATIASIAPWIGIFGTIVGIVNSFPAISMKTWAGIAALSANLSFAMRFTAFGLFVALIAFWCYGYLERRLQALNLEMANASLDLLNQLGRFPGRLAFDSPVAAPVLPTERDHRFLRPCLVTSGGAMILDFVLQSARFDLLSACFYTPFMLATCCVLLYPFWSRFLHRRPGVLVATASVLALCWSVAELALGRALP